MEQVSFWLQMYRDPLYRLGLLLLIEHLCFLFSEIGYKFEKHFNSINDLDLILNLNLD